jgi:hypothetical protein
MRVVPYKGRVEIPNPKSKIQMKPKPPNPKREIVWRPSRIARELGTGKTLPPSQGWPPFKSFACDFGFGISFGFRIWRFGFYTSSRLGVLVAKNVLEKNVFVGLKYAALFLGTHDPT